MLLDVSDKGWKKVEKPEHISEGEVKALFNFIDKDNSKALSLEVKIL